MKDEVLDSNIIIYATVPENEWLRIWLEAEPFAASQISQIEVLGYHQITPEANAQKQHNKRELMSGDLMRVPTRSMEEYFRETQRLRATLFSGALELWPKKVSVVWPRDWLGNEIRVS